MTIKELEKEINKLIGTEKANILMQYVLKVDRKYLIINKDENLNENVTKNAIELAKKVQSGYPVQYITNKAYFMGLEFFVNEDVLIPQPDTEVVVMQVLNEIRKFENKKIKILDLCTGSGAIAISIAKNAENVEILATDKSTKALNVAQKNYEHIIKNVSEKNINICKVELLKSNISEKNVNKNINKVESYIPKKDVDKVNFLESDMFENIDKSKFDIIVSNPPYIEKNVIKTLDKEVRCEPLMALDGGEDGLDFYRIIKENINDYLKKDGILVLEIGYNQRNKLQELFEGAECIKDFANNDRVILWRK